MSSLLADIVSSRQLPAEPVATDALVHLLRRSPAARASVLSLLRSICKADTSFGELEFTGQIVGELDQSRPDIVGSDMHGTRAVIEAKFDADLTAAQLGTTYLDRLEPGQAGALVFLVPQDRIAALWPRVLAGPGQSPVSAEVDLAVADAPFLTHTVGDGRFLAAVSWTRMLTLLRDAMTSSSEQSNLSDLAQIEGLVGWRTRTGWTPLLPGDLPGRTGRQLAALTSSVMRAAGTASATTAKNGSGDYGGGRHIRTPGGRSYWVGLWWEYWGRYSNTPVWVQIKTSQSEPTLSLSELSMLVPGVMKGPSGSDMLVPIMLPLGAEQGAVEASIAAQLAAVNHALDSVGAA